MSNQFDVEDEKAELQEPELELDKRRFAPLNPALRKREAKERIKRNISRWTGWHGKTLASGECGVCMLKPETLEQVKAAYINGVSLPSIKKATGVTQKDLKAHANAEAWDWNRAQQTERALALMQERGIEYVLKNPDAVDGDLLFKVTQHIDKREGKVVERVKNETNVAIQFVGMPTPISPAKNAREQLADIQKPLSLAPTSVEVLDEGTTPAETVQVPSNGSTVSTDE